MLGFVNPTDLLPTGVHTVRERQRELGLGEDLELILLSAQDDAVARVYERVGFERVGTACIAEPAGSTP